MADLTFTCPLCQQSIACDELWSGHEIQCPTCQGTLTVPSQTPAAHNPLVPKPPNSPAPRLSLGRQAQQPAPQGNRNIPIRNLAPPPPQKKSPVPMIIGIVAGVVVLGVATYFGYQFVQSGSEAKAKEAAKSATNAPAAGTPLETAIKPPAPVLPPVWTLEVETAKIPEANANGSIAGTGFTAETVRVDTVGTAQVLRLTQGQLMSPDREVLIYLHLKPGETLSGQSLTISKDMKGEGVPQVTKRWKAGPQSPLQMKAFATGYALKLELGPMVQGVLSGKVFVALPDAEQTVVAGTFKAATGPLPSGSTVSQRVAPGTRGPARMGNVPVEDRYGIAP
jgi:hypothetical protein